MPCAIWLNDLEQAGLPEGGAARRRRSRDRRRPRLLPGRRPRPRPASPSAPPTCGWPARATCSPGSRRCASSCAPRACSSCRSSWRGRCCRGRSASSPPRRAPPGATCSPGCARRGWGGTVVWAFAPVQDRHAAPAIAAALQDLAARPEVEAIVVTRGGGSLADLWAFCDETLCRTVAMLRVPVISAVGHERDSTLIDDVAAVACSTPTHAAEAAVPLDCVDGAARPRAQRGVAAPRRPTARSARAPGTWRRWPGARPGRCGASAVALNQKTREIRAASRTRARRARSPSSAGSRVVVLDAGRGAAPPGPELGAPAARRCARVDGRARAPTTPSARSSAATRSPRTPTASR